MARLIVPDSCALGAAFFKEPLSPNAAPLLAAIRTFAIEAAAPSVLLAEFMNICRKKLKGNSASAPISAADVDAVMIGFLELPIIYFPVDVSFTREAWQTHRNHSIGTNDAYFLFLARHLDGELWTSDSPLHDHASPVYSQVFDLNTRAFV